MDPDSAPIQPLSNAPTVVVFELLLGLIGAVLSLSLEEPLRHRLELTQAAAVRGIVACGPMLAALALMSKSTWRPLVEFRRQVEHMCKTLLDNSSVASLAAISLAAGIGEEILFRGALQPIAEQWTTPAIGLIAVSLLFGAMHAMSMTYFVLATVIGLYFGWIAQHYDDLVAPIIAHALYDFFALMYLRRSGRTNQSL